MVMVVVESQPAAFPAMFHDVVTVGVTGPVNVLALQTVLRNQPPSPEMVRDRYEFILPQSTNRPTNKSMGNSSDTWLHFFCFVLHSKIVMFVFVLYISAALSRLGQTYYC